MRVGDWFYSIIHRFTPGQAEGILGGKPQAPEYSWRRTTGPLGDVITMSPTSLASRTYTHPDIEPLLGEGIIETSKHMLAGVEERAETKAMTAVWRWVVARHVAMCPPAVNPVTPPRFRADIDKAIFAALKFKSDTVATVSAIQSVVSRLARQLTTDDETVTTTQVSVWVAERLPIVKRTQLELAHAVGEMMDVTVAEESGIHYPPFWICFQFAVAAVIICLSVILKFRTFGVLIVFAFSGLIAATIGCVCGWRILKWGASHPRVRPSLLRVSPVGVAVNLAKVVLIGPSTLLLTSILNWLQERTATPSGNG
jgi:hypothetical protein